MKRWAKPECDRLTELFPYTNVMKLSDIFSTTQAAIYAQAYRLGLRKHKLAPSPHKDVTLTPTRKIVMPAKLRVIIHRIK